MPAVRRLPTRSFIVVERRVGERLVRSDRGETMAAAPKLKSGIELAKHLVNLISKAEKEKKSCSTIQYFEIAELLKEVHEIFKAESQMIPVSPPVWICGDVHGQVSDVMRIFKENGKLPRRRYLFLGDYVDRGPNNVDTIVLLFSLKRLFPSDMFLLRGNHETKPVNAVYGFKTELKQRFPGQKKPDGTPFEPGKDLWTYFNKVFDDMSLTALVGGMNGILCMHGGISPSLKSFKDIEDIKKPLNTFPDQGLSADLLWADPDKNAKGYMASPRGVSYLFGPDAVTDKCQDLGISMVARAHQVVKSKKKQAATAAAAAAAK